MYKYLVLVVMTFFIWTLLLSVARFIVAPLGFCAVKGRGQSMKTNCFNLFEFQGEDLLSMYRIKLPKGL